MHQPYDCPLLFSHPYSRNKIAVARDERHDANQVLGEMAMSDPSPDSLRKFSFHPYVPRHLPAFPDIKVLQLFRALKTLCFPTYFVSSVGTGVIGETVIIISR